MKKLSAFLFTLLIILDATASTKRVYMAPIDKSQWTMTKDNVLLCQIEHEIPRFGKAIFYQESGRKIQFKMISKHRYKKDLDVSFRSVTASWKGPERDTDLSRLKTTGNNPVIIDESVAAREAYFELQQGFQLYLDFVDDEDGYNSVSAVVSTVNFRDVEQKFSQCVTELHPYHFDDVKRSLVHFDFDEEFPKIDEEEASLKKMLDYLKVDHHIKTITVVGHTDYKGSVCYNETLSARRAYYIYDYLIQSNVDPKKLFLEFKGEKDPITKKKDEISRAKNRRVEVLLSK